MRRVVFRDLKGHKGSISDEVELTYQGRWEGEIEECLEQIAEEHDLEDLYDHIVVELPERAPIESVERTDIND